MNALDMIYHLSTGWAVHLNYVAIKLTVIFLSVWLITQFIGIGKEEGIVAGILGPLIFYAYYVFAGATLNREIFKIDEQFWFVFLHIALMLIAYFSAWQFVKSKKYLIRVIGFAVTAVFVSVAMHALLIMARWRFYGIDEEAAAKLMTFGLIIVPLAAYLAGVVMGIITDQFMKKKYPDRIVAGITAALVIGLMSGWMEGVFAFAFVNISYLIMHTYKKGLAGGA